MSIHAHVVDTGALPQVFAAALEEGPSGGDTVLLLTADTLGTGSDELGASLLRAFLRAAGSASPLPRTIVCYNGGVRLAVTDSGVLVDLTALARRGVTVMVSSLCLAHFGLTEQLAVGQPAGMAEISETLLRSGKIIAPC